MNVPAHFKNVALVGTPNCGKTALFNQWTGARQKVANYAGVTVEKKTGRAATPCGQLLRILDLPGAYSLQSASPDEAVTRDICLGLVAGEPRPDLIICVLDATNLRLHLRFAFELTRLGIPMILALNMMDAANKRGIKIDIPALSAAFGVPVVPTIAVQKNGARDVLRVIDELGANPSLPKQVAPDDDLHQKVQDLLNTAVHMPSRTAVLDDRLDAIVLHPVAGLVLLAAVLLAMFQAVFAWAAPFQDGIEAALTALGGFIGTALPDGLLKSLLVDGIIAGVGSVVVFLPQILFLFLFILVLEESGYLPRAAFLLDKIMVVAGLSGRSFIPLLSSFACAIPGIMAARSIHNTRDRLVTILVAPLMTCSARLPVYTLLIGAFIPSQTVWGFLNLQGLVLFGLYISGIVAAFGVAYAMKFLRRDHGDQPFLMELPSYRRPRLRDIGLGLWMRAGAFLKRAGGIILALSIVLWALTTFPYPPAGATEPAINYSFAGMLGHALAPLFAPLGFNWQITVALIPGMAAREIAVSALATVYAVADAGSDAGVTLLGTTLAAQWSLATALSMLVWYIFAPQCLATLAVIRRETNSARVMWLAVGYLFALAYLASFLTYQLAR